MRVYSSPTAFQRPTYAEVDRSRIRTNFLNLRSMVPDGTFVCPMIKASAYGHGDIEVAKVLREAGAPYVGVALIEEAIGIRQSGDKKSLLTFGLFDERGAEAIFEYQLTPAISDWYQLEALDKISERHGFSGTAVHIKFNTGMNRLGFRPDEAPRLREWLDTHPRFQLEGVCTHLLRGDDAGVPGGETESQLESFSKALLSFQGLKFYAHALNSSGTASLWNRHKKKAELGRGGMWPLGIRPGISLYGVQPSTDEGVPLPVEPALSLKSQLVMVNRLAPGERVSYNATWRAARSSLVGVIPIGYADGYFRLFSNKASVLCRGIRVPVRGTVCMDYIMVDLTEVEACSGPIAPGEEVVLLGSQGRETILASELASLIGTIPYEVLTSISERVPRVYVR